ncbi:TIGR03943 family protein [Streptomyces sp. NPDC046887]|uniref:TIGR03943 family putative permease subunit n=1 Tax=Streptomyces sp. NPDC046887 TaxID=3155472 RepID=UPI0033C52B75
MKAPLQSALLLAIAAALLRVSLLSDICLRYVKPGLQPWLVATGFVLLATGILSALHAVAAARRPRPAHPEDGRPGHGGPEDGEAPRPAAEDGCGHHHGHAQGPRIAWLLALPALTLLLFAPPALGSYTASRDSASIVAEVERFEALPPGAAPLALAEFIARVQQDEKKSLAGRTVVMQGFVTPRTDGAWDLSRLLVACCAADSQSLTVTVHGMPAPPADSWVRVSGTWHPEGTLGTPGAALALDATEVRPIPEPRLPYLDRAPVLTPDGTEPG